MRLEPRALVILFALGILCAFVAPGQAGNENEVDATYYRDVLPVLQANCQGCHRPEGLRGCPVRC